jgi:flagellar biosynthesis protein FlhB
MFLSILGFIGGGLMAFASLFMVIGVASGEMVQDDEAPALFAAAALYAILTGMYLFVSILLFKYGRAIGYLLQFNRNQELEEALDAQRRFWKAMGVIAIITMALMVVAMFAGVGIAIAEGL